jgi:hypothetical protein
MLVLNLYHATTSIRADEILPKTDNRAVNFQDGDEVQFFDKPDLEAEVLLDICVGEDDVAIYEQTKTDAKVREWRIPASYVNGINVQRVPRCHAEIIREGLHETVYFGNAPDVEGVESCTKFAFHSEYLFRLGEVKFSACEDHRVALTNAALRDTRR